MELSWATFFALLTCLAAVLLAAAGAVCATGKWSKLHFPVAAAAFVSMVLGLLSGAIYLGHPERIFGAFANPNSVLSRELIVVFVSTVFMGIYAYKLFRQEKVSLGFSVLAIAVAIVLAVFTWQLIRMWTSDDASLLYQVPSQLAVLLQAGPF